MRAALVALLLLIAPATASAWSDPAEVPQNTVADLAADGTLVKAWHDDAGLHAQIGEAAPVLLDPGPYAYPQLTVSGNDVAVAWMRERTTMIATGTAGSAFGAPQTFSGNVRIVGNGRGDMALMTDGYSVSFRPAGGSFGPLVASPAQPNRTRRVLLVDPSPALVLGPTGELLLAWTDPRLHVVSRRRDSAIEDVVDVPGEPRYAIRGGPEVALDAHGRALAIWSGEHLQVAVRDADGHWRAATGVPATRGAYPQVATGDDGQGVVGYTSDDGYQAARVSLADGAFGTPVDYPLTVNSEGIPPPVESTATATGYPRLSVAADGRSTLVWNRYREILVARDLGAPEVAACQPLDGHPEPLGDGAALLINRYPDGQRSIVRDAPGPVPTCPPPESPRGKAHASYSRHRVVAGEPVRIEVVNLRYANATIESNAWTFGADVVTNRSEVLRHTFPQPGRVKWSVRTKQSIETGWGVERIFNAAVNVYARATLRVTPSGRILASAFTYGPRRRVTVVSGGRRRTLFAGLEPRRVPLRARGASVRLIQGGKVLARTPRT